METLHRRRATLGEVYALFDLHRDAFKHHVEQLWGVWDENWQRNNFLDECASSVCEVVLRGTCVLGYVQYTSRPKRFRVWNIALWPEFRGQGIGTQVIRDLQQLALAEGADLDLRVFPTNPAAFRFYAALGFREIGRTPTGIELTWTAV